MTAPRRWLLIAVCLAGGLAIGAFVAYRFALGELRAQVIAALGPESEIGEIDLSFRAIQISGLKLRAPANWPSKYALSAERVVIIPDLSSLFSDTVFISTIKVERAYLALLRDRGGKVRLVPSLTERKAKPDRKSASGPAATATPVLIGEIVLKDSSVSFFDADIRSPPLEVKMRDVDAQVTNLRMPDLTEKSGLKFKAKIAGPSQEGTLAVDGWMVFANTDSELKTVVRGVEIASLEPYLIKKAETGVRKGVLDLDVNSVIAAQRVTAPGVLKLKALELRSEGGVGTFMGMPRDSVVGMLRERDGSITIPFTVQGNLNDPNFSLDSAFKAKVGLAAAATLGLTIKGLLDVLGNKQDGSGDSGNNVNKTLDVLKGLLGK